MNIKLIPLFVLLAASFGLGVGAQLHSHPDSPDATAATLGEAVDTTAKTFEGKTSGVKTAASKMTNAAPRVVPVALQGAPEVAAGTIAITVPAGARQRFDGFGASVGNWKGTYQQLSPTERTQLSRLFWHDLKFNSLRLWMNVDEYSPTPGAHDLSAFKRMYVDSGLIADAQKQGVTTLLLAPDKLPPYMAENTNLKDGEAENYATILADFIRQLKTETGITLTATGIQNEPNNHNNGPGQFSNQQMVDAVKKLRSELDARGLQTVKIIAPETGNVDGVHYAYMDALKADPDAWNALVGVSSHSYNMAATDKAASYVGGEVGANSKEYWMTESSENGAEEPGDMGRAVMQSARFLNDMNHRVTRWMHFLGFETDDPKDNATRILAYTPNPFHITTFAKYYAYKQLSDTFDVGAVFRDSESSLDKDMTWTYGTKAHVTVATAQNPDGSWGVGLANFTADSFAGVQGWADNDWNKTQNGYTPAQSFPVTINIAELKTRAAVPFTVYRTNKTAQDKKGETVTMKNGQVTITVAPMEVVTLRSVAPRGGNR